MIRSLVEIRSLGVNLLYRHLISFLFHLFFRSRLSPRSLLLFSFLSLSSLYTASRANSRQEDAKTENGTKIVEDSGIQGGGPGVEGYMPPRHFENYFIHNIAQKIYSIHY